MDKLVAAPTLKEIVPALEVAIASVPETSLRDAETIAELALEFDWQDDPQYLQECWNKIIAMIRTFREHVNATSAHTDEGGGL